MVNANDYTNYMVPFYAPEDFIVKKALEYKLGARGLRSLCEAILNDAMFELPQSDVKSLKVSKQYAEAKLSVIELPELKIVS